MTTHKKGMKMNISDDEIRQKTAELNDIVNKIEELIASAETLADEYGLNFSLSPAYGMGGSFQGRGTLINDDFESSDEYNEDNYGWTSSSQNC